MLPAGWDSSPSGGFHAALFLVGKASAGDSFSVAVVNMGEGSQYHPTVAVPPAAQMRQAMYFIATGVEKDKLEDSSFWFMLLQPLLYPSAGESS